MEELPNGFLYNPTKKTPGFESAGDAIRRHESEAASGRRSADIRDAQQQALYDGWRVADPEKPATREPAPDPRRWTSETGYRPQDILRYLRVPDVAAGETGPVFDFNELSQISRPDRRWSWVEINLPAIQNNVMAIKGILRPDTLFMAIIKADAYGHGAVKVARTALNSGADYLGVATVDEGIAVRKGDIDAPVLLLSEPPMDAIPLLLAYRLMPAVSTAEFAVKYAEAADAIGLRAPFHLKINTGMNRVGVRYSEVIALLDTISFHRALDLVGTFTHFATADTPDVMDFRLQRQRFEEALAAMRSRGYDPGIVHAANSSATLRYPEVHYDMVRVGIAMYGSYPCPMTVGAVNLMPSMSVHSRIRQVNQVPVGEGVSYGLRHRSSGFAKTCTIPLGYADGLGRALSGKINFIMNGVFHPQVGAICMDQCMFEVDQRTRNNIGKIEPEVGDEVVVIGAQGNSFITVEDMAEAAGTIPYEIMIRFGNLRLPRVYT